MLGDVTEWLMRPTSNLRIADRMGSNPVRAKPLWQAVVSLSMKLYIHCLVLVGYRNGFESIPISLQHIVNNAYA
jgi:hypothetical protein